MNASVDMTETALRSVLSLAYNGKCDIGPSNFGELCVVSKQFEIDLLANHCGKYLLDNMVAENAVDMLHLSKVRVLEYTLYSDVCILGTKFNRYGQYFDLLTV